MKLTDYNNIAILQTAFIGDVVLALPLIQLIKNLNPASKITFITTPQAKDIPLVCSVIDEVIVFDKRDKYSGLKGIFRFSELLNKNNYDLWICLHRSFRSTMLSYLQKNPFKMGFNNSSFKFVYDKVIEYRKYYHEIERNLEFIKVFESENTKVNLSDVDFKFKENDIEIANKLLKDNNLLNQKYIVIAPGSVWETKKWKEEHFSELCILLKKENINVILSGSKSDQELCSRIKEKSGAFSFAGITNIPQTLYIIKNGALVITNDSAPTHFAGLMNTPVITIYGPTSPIFGFGPRSEKSLIVRNENLKCSPCRIHGSKKCPLGTHECMTSISPEYIYTKTKNLLKDIDFKQI